MRSFLRSKIHRAIVTDANLNYEGSISIDCNLMDAAKILEYEQVHIWNVTSGTRFITYAIAAEENSGIICINGAAAHLVDPSDIIIIATFHLINAEEIPTPIVVHVDEKNNIISKHKDIA